MNTQAPRIVIVGGVAGGATAAARARRANARAEITILEKGPAVSFANCGLPYHLGGEISDRDKLLMATAELFWDRFRIRVRTGHAVERIDRDSRQAVGRTERGELFCLPYDKLILATGSEPFRPEFCQVAANVFQLWTLDDMDRILAYHHQFGCRQATVIGAGFVGLEVIEQLVRLGIQTNLVELLPQVLGPLDVEMAKLIELELDRHNVNLYLGAQVQELTLEDGRARAVRLADGRSLETELVIVGVGVRPRIQLASQAGLTIGSAGGVVINAYCQTSDPDIYAVGDMVEYPHGALGKPSRVPLAGPANRSGRIAGAHAATSALSSSESPTSRGSSRALTLAPVQGTAIVRVFDLAAGITGLSQRACHQHGVPCHSAIIQAPHHASYFPGSKNLTIKLVYHPETRRVLGAQAVGAVGADKRLDVVATLLHFGGTIDDLSGLDLAYAPPFGSARDPIHIAAFVAQNDLAEYPRLVPPESDWKGLQIVDVRQISELERLPLPGAIHIPVDQIAERWRELDPELPTLVVCHSGKRAHLAASWLKGQGFSQVSNLGGGLSIRQLIQPFHSYSAESPPDDSARN